MTLTLRRYFYLAVLLLSVGLQSGCDGTPPNENATAPYASGTPEHSFRERPSDLLPVIRRLSRPESANFGIFHSTPEGLPHSVRETLRRPSYGANWNLAQRLAIASRIPVWVLPANAAICLIEEQRGGAIGVTCTPTGRVVRHGIVTASLAGGKPPPSLTRRTVVGVVPDHIPKVRVKTRSFGATVVQVRSNTFILRDSVSDPPESVELLRDR
jgi:hypothetical protein